MILSGVVFLPIVFALIIAFWPYERTLKTLAFGFSAIEFILSLGILFRFDHTSAALQLVEKHVWIERFGINYFFGIDGISLWLVLLTTFLTPIVLLGSWTSI